MKPEELTIDQAIYILHPDTTVYAILELKDKWDGQFYDACQLACAAMEKQIPKKPVVENGVEVCPSCYSDYIMDDYGMIYNHCVDCGQAIDWGN